MAAHRVAFPRRSDRTIDWQLCATSGCRSTIGLERQKLSGFSIHFSVNVQSGNHSNEVYRSIARMARGQVKVCTGQPVSPERLAVGNDCSQCGQDGQAPRCFRSCALVAVVVSAGDADSIGDFCVGDLSSKITINVLVHKPSATAVAEDFAFRVFHADRDTNNGISIALAPGFAGINYPALNAQRFALAKFYYAKGGLVPPHTHPRAAEVIYVVKGEVHVGFVDTAGKLFAKTLKRGDFFLLPQGLVHFQRNSGNRRAVTISVLNGQNPGVQFSTALSASTRAMGTDILARSFGIDKAQVEQIMKSQRGG